MILTANNTFFILSYINHETTEKLIKFITEHSDLDDEKKHNLFLCSNGGNIKDATAICNLITNCKLFDKVICSGVVGSSALDILLTFEKEDRLAYEDCLFFTHGIHQDSNGTIEEAREMIQYESLYNLNFAKKLDKESEMLNIWFIDHNKNVGVDYINTERATKIGLISRIIN